MKCSRWEIIPGITCYGNQLWIFRMLVLSMTAFHYNQVPTIFSYHLNYFPDFLLLLCTGGSPDSYRVSPHQGCSWSEHRNDTALLGYRRSAFIQRSLAMNVLSLASRWSIMDQITWPCCTVVNLGGQTGFIHQENQSKFSMSSCCIKFSQKI